MDAETVGILPGEFKAAKGELNGTGLGMEVEALGGEMGEEQATEAKKKGIARG